MSTPRHYPSEVSDDEWTFVAPYLALIREDAPQRLYPLRDLFNAVRYLGHTGCPTTCRPGPRSTSSGRAGGMPAFLKIWYTI